MIGIASEIQLESAKAKEWATSVTKKNLVLTYFYETVYFETSKIGSSYIFLFHKLSICWNYCKVPEQKWILWVALIKIAFQRLLYNDFATSAPPKLKDYPLAWLLKRVSQLFERLSPVQWVKQFMKDKIGGAADKLDKYMLYLLQN